MPGGASVDYDLIASTQADDLTAVSAVCTETLDSDTTATDTTVLAPGQIRFFVARAVGGCGPGSGGASRVLHDCS